MKKILILMGLLILVYVGRQTYYYRAYNKEIIKDRVVPTVLETENKTYKTNVVVGNISADTIQLKEGEFTCVENRCVSGEFILLFNEGENPKLKGEYSFFSSNEENSFFKYEMKDEEINKYLEDISVNYLSELQHYYLNSEYKEVNFFSKVSDIKTAVINNEIRSVVEPNIKEVFIIDNNIRVYQVNDYAYSIEWADNDKSASIMLKSDVVLTQDQLLNFIDSIEYNIN